MFLCPARSPELNIEDLVVEVKGEDGFTYLLNRCASRSPNIRYTAPLTSRFPRLRDTGRWPASCMIAPLMTTPSETCRRLSRYVARLGPTAHIYLSYHAYNVNESETCLSAMGQSFADGRFPRAK
jgi:hypothetical protein